MMNLGNVNNDLENNISLLKEQYDKLKLEHSRCISDLEQVNKYSKAKKKYSVSVPTSIGMGALSLVSLVATFGSLYLGGFSFYLLSGVLSSLITTGFMGYNIKNAIDTKVEMNQCLKDCPSIIGADIENLNMVLSQEKNMCFSSLEKINEKLFDYAASLEKMQINTSNDNQNVISKVKEQANFSDLYFEDPIEETIDYTEGKSVRM